MLRSPFHEFHVAHGARFVDFAGWQMPIMYTSVHAEHNAVRNNAGLFDVSHMGRLRFTGPGARKLLERVATRYLSDMDIGQSRYSLLCNPEGGVIDDVIISRMDESWYMVCNASNRKAVKEHLQANVEQLNVRIEDLTLSTAMIALQGPRVVESLAELDDDFARLKRYRFVEKELLLTSVIVSRTGYTGEDGVEIILPANATAQAIELFTQHGGDTQADDSPQVTPAGLGARDTLRLEAGMPLYGHELDARTDPLAAGLGFAVTLDKDQRQGGLRFIGQDALEKIAQAGPPRKLVGLKIEGKRTPRQGKAVFHGQEPVGIVTSGCLSPTLGLPIAMAYVDARVASREDSQSPSLQVELSGDRRLDAELTPLPFYKRG